MADGEDAPAQRKPARHLGAVCVTVRLEAELGGETTVEQALAHFASAVRAEEPGCTSYYLSRQIGSNRHFAVHARFADWAAFNAHAETPHMEHALARLTPALAAPVALEIFLEV
ncbi:MAG TPA: antibiotic biosynthesis monooxygenase [Terricaulis sp.]|nr:antibiotic biosynthesis monooxygenase [Terricaulis sp.]